MRSVAASTAGLMLLPFLTVQANAGLFSIAAPQFSGFVNADNYAVADPAVSGSISRGKLRQGSLYFSFRVLAGARAIEHLNKYGSLEITVSTYAGWKKLGDYTVGITQDNWRRNGKALTEEFRQNGIFNWRTYMQTEQVASPSISVKISDANSNYVGPVDDGGAYEATVNIIP